MRALALFLAAACVQAHAAPFDKGGVLGVGARDAAMAGAVVAGEDGAEAIWWNPAGIDVRPDYDTSIDYGDLQGGRQFDTAFSHRGVLLPASLGYGIGYLHSGEPLDIADQETALGLAFPFTQDGSVVAGFDVRSLQETVSHADASGYGLDLGMRYKAPLGLAPLTLGLAARDIQAGLSWSQGGAESLPEQLFQAGAQWKLDALSRVEFDSEYESDPLDPERNDSGFKVGFERSWNLERYGLSRVAALRLGYLQSSGIRPTALGGAFTVGAGLQAWGWSLDYALTQSVSSLGASQRVALQWDFAPASIASQARPPYALEAKEAPAPAPRPAPSPLPTPAAAPGPAVAAQPLAVTLSATPALFNPRQQGANIVFTVGAPAVLSSAAGSLLRVLGPDGSALAEKAMPGVPGSFSWDGRRKGGAWADPGAYRATLGIWDAFGVTLASAEAPFRLELGTGKLLLQAQQAAFAPLPRSTRPQARLLVSYDGYDAVHWTFTVRRQGLDRPLRVLAGRALPDELAWNGLDARHRRAPDGAYALELQVLTKGGSTATAQALVQVDTRRPEMALDSAPRVFAVEGAAPGLTLRLGARGAADGVLKWSLKLETRDGRALRSFGGPGAPPSTQFWDGRSESGAAVAGGSLVYADFRVEMQSGAVADPPRLALASRLEDPKLPFRVPLGTVHFDAGDDGISVDEFAALKEAAAAVKKYNSEYAVQVLGHAEAGEAAHSAQSELELSFLRANAVRDYLVDNEGLDKGRVRASGLGDLEAAAGEGTTDRRRRVEIILYVK